MDYSPSRRRFPRRLALLSGALLVALTGLAAQRLWFSPEARERQAAKKTLSQLEEESAAGSRDPLAHYWLGRRRQEAGDLPGAATAFEAALRLDPSLARARAALGTALLLQDQDHRGAYELRQALHQDPRLAEAHLSLALFYQRYAAWKRVGDAADEAIRLEPRNPTAWLFRGHAANWLRQPEKALECYERAAALAPGDAEAHALAAQALLALNRFEAAEERARAAVRAGPQEGIAHLALGDALLRRGPAKLGEAAQAYERALELGEATSETHLGLGSARLRQKQFAAAERHLRAAIHADRMKNEARYELVRALQAQGREREAAAAERELEEWSKLDERLLALRNQTILEPENPRPWFAMGRLYARALDWPAAERAVRAGLQRAPEDAEGKRLLEEMVAHAP